MNLGVAPTFGAGARRLEVHLADWREPLYGERLLVFVVARLRDERRFENAAALGAQIAADRAAAEAVWAAAEALPWAEWALQG
jgi:riboflavin kinase/FMN adenylyltransferase